MQNNVDYLGNYIEQIDRRNCDLIYGVDDVMGITNTKVLMETKARPEYADLSKFYILEPGEFIYNPRTSRNGEKVGMAYNNTNHNILFTFNNIPFRIKFDKTDELDADFLYLFFLNPEFDRYARYNSWGSATELFPWEEMCRMKVPVPPIEEQRQKVCEYQTVADRINLLTCIDNNLKAQMSCIFQGLFETTESERWEKKRLGEYLSLEKGLSYKGDYLSEDGTPMINLGNILPNSTYRFEKIKYYTGEYAERHVVRPGDILVANTDLTSMLEVIGSAIMVPHFDDQTVICSHHISIVRNCSISKYYILGLFNRPAFRERVKGFATGTTVYAIPNETVLNFEVNIPPEDIIEKYDKAVIPLYEYKDAIQSEMCCLLTLKERILEGISYGRRKTTYTF